MRSVSSTLKPVSSPMSRMDMVAWRSFDRYLRIMMNTFQVQIAINLSCPFTSEVEVSRLLCHFGYCVHVNCLSWHRIIHKIRDLWVSVHAEMWMCERLWLCMYMCVCKCAQSLYLLYKYVSKAPMSQRDIMNLQDINGEQVRFSGIHVCYCGTNKKNLIGYSIGIVLHHFEMNKSHLIGYELAFCSSSH